MRFLVDAQLPPALARWLTDRGGEAAHVADLGLLGAGDEEIWRVAVERGAVVISKDEDFALRSQLRGAGPQVRWIRWGNVRTGELLRRFAGVWPAAEEALRRGESLVEIA